MDKASGNSSIVVALDGPAASGKGTLARLISDHYGLAYLDTGTLYRGVAWLVMREGGDPADRERAAAAARDYAIEKLSGADIRTKEVGAAASVVAANSEVRAALLDFQRRFAETPPKNAVGAVLDGRDIGTVVCPDATVKFFVTASPKTRAHRRWLELIEARPELQESEIYQDLLERDARDAARDDAPMAAAQDAELLDTTHLSIDAAFAAARRVIDGVFRRCG
ncbi:(d)CMP kinase [Hyphococcus flavus]|uniref:Cytidylate kinase n=1 Tax=Hyphococcus flavus TaxID=1866326 RepID=A0AAE9ZGY1_9PROT|nr:(d)CMP kinase [Hyphococcus flavus]WDI30000.1 (d)CMP kinase [Hyphococcus flavus]